MGQFAVEIEPGHKGRDGQPSVSPVYRNVWAKEGFPQPVPGLNTSWEIFSASCQKNSTKRMVGRREIKDGKAGKYTWQTYGEVYDQALKIGSAIRACGIEPACSSHNVTCVPLYDTLGANSVEFILRNAEISIVFFQDIKFPELLNSIHKCPAQVKTLVCFTSFSRQQEDAAGSLGITVYSWQKFLKLGDENPTELSPPRPLDISTIMYTSGTSGEPKGVILTQETLAMNIAGVEFIMEKFEEKMTSDDVYLSFLPLAHILDRVIEEFFFHRGASVGYWQGDPKLLAEDLMELKPTLFAGVPRVFDRIYAGGMRTLKESNMIKRLLFSILYNYKLAWIKLGFKQSKASPLADSILFSKIKARLGGRVRLILSGAAPLNSSVEEFLRVTTCAHVLQGYGLTETGGISSVCLPDEISMLGTVGPPSPTTEVCLESVPEMGYDALAVIPQGELCFRGKTMFSGYYKREDLTKEAFKDGWFHTGDIGELRPNGTLKIIDRKKNIFKLAQGEYIAVEHLENVYGQCACIDAFWVYGNSFESSLVGVAVPNQQEAEFWAKVNGQQGNFNTLCMNPKLKAFILEELTAVAKKNNLRGFEFVKAIHLDPRPFDVERDLITPTFKKKRFQLLKYYQEEINNMYKGLKN
eukprot:Gb_09959 [translate_table: standard]